MGNMKLYIVLWKDRHTDTTAKPFFNFNEAKEWARKQARDSCSFPEDFQEIAITGWLYHVQYSCESDSLWITEHDI